MYYEGGTHMISIVASRTYPCERELVLRQKRETFWLRWGFCKKILVVHLVASSSLPSIIL